MYGIASLFFFVIFRAFITPELATEYLAGVVLLGAAPCTAMVFVWKYCIAPLGGVFGIYELLPAFVISCVFIVVVSLLTAEPEKEIQEEFERACAK